MSKIGTIIYQGKNYEIWLDSKQWNELKFSGGRFWVNSALASDFKLIEPVFNKFCEVEIRKIIDKQLAKLRLKKIEIDIPYTNGKTIFKKKSLVSVDDYLKIIQFTPKLDYKVGVYEREWGINEVKHGSKLFTLYFNLNLIKFDSGSHIEYVVAHELTHVFFRDHGPEFQATLQKLYPRKSESEYFFNWKLGYLFGKQDNSTFYVFVVGIVAVIFIYWLYMQIGVWWNSFFAKPVQQFY